MKKTMFQKGFTLIEMLVVIAIIAILASIFLVGLQGFRGSAYDARRLSDVTNIQSKLELYYNEIGSYPADLGTLATKLGTLPKDPSFTGSSTGYYYCVSTSTQSYIVGAQLSTSNSAANSSLRSVTDCGSNSLKLDGGSGTLTCDKDNQYCLGPGSSG